MKNAISGFVVLLWFTLAFPLSTEAQETESKAKKPPAELLIARVLIQDADGQPLEDATVFPSGLRTKAEPGSHWGWSPERHGPLPKLRTNAEGIVEVPYPKYVQEKLETGQITWSVEHPDFVNFREDRNVDDNPAVIQLKRGFRIAASAIDAETGKSIQADLYGILAGDSRASDWKIKDNGMLVSPVFDPQQTTLRIVKCSLGQPLLFSDMIDVDPKDRSRVLLRDVKLSVGTRVEGRLDDSVVRPIKNGYVSIWIVRKSNSPDGGSWNNRWTWMDKTPIAEDGTFVFESLPKDEVLQMIPICDDWVPKKPTVESILPFFPDAANQLGGGMTVPQLVKLEGALVKTTVLMEPATSVRVAVVDENGDPLPRAEVVMWPNQLWFDGGSQILGDAYPMPEVLRASRDGEYKWSRELRFSAKTDAAGIAVINNLPINSTESIAVSLNGFEMLIKGTDRNVSVDLKPDKTAEITIRMQPKGTQVLDQNAFAGDKIAELELSFQSAADRLLRLWQNFF